MSESKTCQINLRLDSETKSALSIRQQQTKLNASEIVRRIILYGKVEVVYGEKDIMRYIARVHDALNQNQLSILNEIQRLERILERVQNSCNQITDSNELCRLLNDTANLIESWQTELRTKQCIAERMVVERVNIQRGE
jgi:hypothetical protein